MSHKDVHSILAWGSRWRFRKARSQMPMDFFCEGCGLVFSAGMYGVRSRYPFRTLLVCRACGTVHQFRRPGNKKNPFRLLALPGPLIPKKKPEGPTFLNKELKWTECATPVGLKNLRQGDPTEPDFDEIICACCMSGGMLTSLWEHTDKRCPACHVEKLIVICGWIT